MFRNTRQIAVVMASMAAWLGLAGASDVRAQTPKLLPPPPPTPVAPMPASQASPAPAVPLASPAAGPLAITDIVAMHQAGLSDPVIIGSIQQNHVASALGAHELIAMRQHGVSNDVIQAMQQYAPLPAPRAAQASAQTQVRTARVSRPPVIIRPTIVQPAFIPAPPVVVVPPIYAPYPRPRCRVPVRSSSFGIHVRF